MDAVYRNGDFQISEVEHTYGDNIHILKDPVAWTYLAHLGHPNTVQPEFTEMIRILYRQMLHVVMAHEFPKTDQVFDTRMLSVTPEGRWHGMTIDPASKVVTVDLARAGMVPSQVCFEVLHRVLPNSHIRQDHIVMNRATDAQQKVTGADVFGQKVGGPIENRILLFPDPMGATGSSICQAIDTYKNSGLGTPSKIIALHMILTPEYIRTIQDRHPDLQVYGFRLDRGLSPPEVKETMAGTHWEQERGLNDVHYIIPGGGGFGELLNNAEK